MKKINLYDYRAMYSEIIEGSSVYKNYEEFLNLEYLEFDKVYKISEIPNHIIIRGFSESGEDFYVLYSINMSQEGYLLPLMKERSFDNFLIEYKEMMKDYNFDMFKS